MDKRVVFLILLLSSGGSVAESKKEREATLAMLAQALPGRYTNVEQVEADRAAGREPHAALEVNIVPAYAPRISDHTFYIQESDANDPRRIFTQRFIAFTADKKRGIVQRLWTFTEPLRWRDAHRNTDLFKSMTMQDLVPMTGCDLIWKKKDSSFEAANDQASCRVSSAAAETVVRLKLRVEFSLDDLALSEQSFDASGKPLQAVSPDPFYRLKRR